MEPINIKAIQERILELEKRRESIAKDNNLNWESMTFKEKYDAKRLEHIRRVQQDTFRKFLKSKYPLYLDNELELFSEYFELLLESKVNNMIDYMYVKVESIIK